MASDSRLEGLARMMFERDTYQGYDKATLDHQYTMSRSTYMRKARAVCAWLIQEAEEEAFTEDNEELANCAVSALSWLRSLTPEETS